MSWPELGRWPCLNWPCYFRVWAKSYADGMADTGHLFKARRDETPLEGSIETDSDQGTKSPEGAWPAEMWESSQALPVEEGCLQTEQGRGHWQPRAESEVSTAAQVLLCATLCLG